jgi:hypothetical protein
MLTPVALLAGLGFDAGSGGGLPKAVFVTTSDVSKVTNIKRNNLLDIVDSSINKLL